MTKQFGGLVAVRDINLDIPTGGIVSIIGPNGAGKTTFFNVIAGIIDPTAGTVAFKGTTLISRPRRVWLESVLWVVPALLVAIVALAFGAGSAGNDGLVVTSIGRPGTRHSSAGWASCAARVRTTSCRPGWAVPSRTSGCSRT